MNVSKIDLVKLGGIMDIEGASGIHLSFEGNIVDATALWDAAAAHAIGQFAMLSDDVVETIGPREDPDIEACVLMLLDTLTRMSGIFDSIAITALTPAVAPRIAAPGAVRTAQRPTGAVADRYRDRSGAGPGRAPVSQIVNLGVPRIPTTIATDGVRSL